ncbi:MAG: DNA mismatch repair endonuclease MutL [Planctomycetes bacterium]|nr:DNA mismatch repair endonuclease MutL [Planctomycetota bacterium]
MPEIRVLTASVVNKIAAGEVIERPASVVKELMENAVDAGAARIDVTLEKGGIDLVRIVDDGCGIHPEQLPLAVASHATSKIRDADDLFRVGTLGFRGEALASIAEVSQLRIRSRPAEAQAGAELEVIGGRAGEIAPCGCAVGTTLEVRNLFCNTPVRRKFLRTTPTEVGHCSEAFTRIALAFPTIHFTLRHNERVLHELPAVANWRERIAAIFPGDLAESLIPVESGDGQVRLTGFAADPSQNRSNNRMQYLLLNGRCIRDRSLQHALGEAYRGLLLTGRYPIAFLRLEMPPDLVDVNVHPSKLEVRFQDGGRVYSQLLGAIRKKFLATDLTARVASARPHALEEAPAAAHDDDAAERHRRELVEWAKGQLGAHQDDEEEEFASQAPPPYAARQPEFDLDYEPPPSAPLTATRLDRSWSPGGGSRPPAVHNGHAPSPPHANAAAAPHPAEPPRRALAMQVQNRYLVTETEEGMVVIDQHALHERVLYEQLRDKVLSRSLETQRLLAPEPVHLTPEEAAAALEAKDLLAQLGVQVEPFGGDTVLVSSYPAMLANINPAEVLRQAVEHLLSGGKQPERRDLLDELLHMISCKAAIKAGDRLSPEEIDTLIQQRHLFQDTHHCPHGRPTSLVFTREELDRRFKRT